MTTPMPHFPPRSARHEQRIAESRDFVPGGSTNSLLPPEGLEFLIERGDGPHVFDIDGRRYLDFMLGAGPLIFGHAHPRIVSTITTQAALGTHYFGLSDRTVDLARRIVDLVPSAEAVRFASSGTETTMHALRLARAVTGRCAYIKFDGAWHGHHDLVVWSMEGAPTVPEPYQASAGIQHGVRDDIVVLPYNDAKAVREMLRAHPDRFAAVICEPAQRMLTPEPGFLETLREECSRTGTVLIFDEIVTGFRIAAGGAQERFGVTPDLTTLGKAMSGGLPLAAIAGRRDLMEHLSPTSDPASYSFHCGTYNGSALAVACAHTTLDMLVEEGGLAKLEALGQTARDKLARLFADRGISVQIAGIGPMFHFFFTQERIIDYAGVRASNIAFSDAVHRLLYRQGIYKQFSKGYLSTVHTEDHIDAFCDMLGWALQEIAI